MQFMQSQTMAAKVYKYASWANHAAYMKARRAAGLDAWYNRKKREAAARKRRREAAKQKRKKPVGAILERSNGRVVDAKCPTCRKSLMNDDGTHSPVYQCKQCDCEYCDICGDEYRGLCESCNHEYEASLND